MADTAAHLVDRVLAAVPYRQWVQTLPIGVRLLAVRDSQLLSDVLRVFVRRVSAWYRLEARRLGFPPSEVQPASVTAIRLFGGALNSNPHFHAIFADGVFHQCADGAVELVPALSPTDEDVARSCRQVAWRVPRCGHGPRRVIAAVDDAPLVTRILAHLGLSTERPVIAEARSPPQLELVDDLGDSDFAASDDFGVN